MRILVHFHLSNNDDDNQHVHELGHKAKRMIVVLTLIMCKVKEQACVSVIVYFRLICQNKTNVNSIQNKDLLTVLTYFLCKTYSYCLFFLISGVCAFH